MVFKWMLAWSIVLGPCFLHAQEWPAENTEWGISYNNPNINSYVHEVRREQAFVETSIGEIPTLNNMGMLVTNTEVSVEFFLEEIITSYAGTERPLVLSVGEGIGNIAKVAIAKNISFIANDISPHHLAHLWKETSEQDRKSLYLKLGNFPNVNLPNASLDAVIFSRVLHVLTGKHIRESLEKAYNLLKVGGMIYGRVSTPYQRHLQFFLPEYRERIRCQEKWPGIIEGEACIKKGWPDIWQYMPLFMHLLDKPELERELLEIGFTIKRIEYVPIKDERFYLQGKEALIFVAMKGS